MEGTYPLPEAQLDRFLFKVVAALPEHRRHAAHHRHHHRRAAVPEVAPVFPPREAAARVEELKTLVREVLVAPHLEEYAAGAGARHHPARLEVRARRPRAAGRPTSMIARYVAFGSSPRGGQALLLGAKVRALLAGRVNVTYDDIDRVAVPALNHRLVLNFAARADDIDPRALIQRLLDAARRLHR